MKTRVFMAVAMAGTASAAFGELIYQSVSSIRNDYGNFSGTYDIDKARDQSGLAASYTSGVTDFDSFVATTHTLVAADKEWFDPGTGFTPGGFVDFDLGQSLNLTKIAIWNEEVGGIGNLNIYVSSDSLFTSSTLVGNFTLADNLQGFDYLGESLDIADTVGQYVRLEILSRGINSAWNGVSMGEIAFGSSPDSLIPLPSASAMAGLGLLGLGVRRRRESL